MILTDMYLNLGGPAGGATTFGEAGSSSTGATVPAGTGESGTSSPLGLDR